jgi:hypothetical protein
MILGLTQLRHSLPQRHVFACGSTELADLLVCDFSALRAEKIAHKRSASTMLPQAENAASDTLWVTRNNATV